MPHDPDHHRHRRNGRPRRPRRAWPHGRGDHRRPPRHPDDRRPVTGEAERIWTNHPDAYPVSGRKPFQPNRWTATVLDRHETFVANTYEGIKEVFGDHELIRSLGCESVMNLPAIAGGRVLGTVNCLDAAGHWTPQRLADSEALRLPATAVFLFHLMASEMRP